ncbi:MAG: hypothetical protein ACM3SP_07570 [Chloroflexota bacterium]
MNMIGEFASRVFNNLSPVFDWALNNWSVTLTILAMVIYLAGKQRRLNQRRH